MKIVCKSITAVISNIKVLDLTAETQNGGVFVIEANSGISNIIIRDSTFKNVSAKYKGSVLYLSGQEFNLTMINNTVTCKDIEVA